MEPVPKALVIAAMLAFASACSERTTSSRASPSSSSLSRVMGANHVKPLVSASSEPVSLPVPSATNHAPSTKRQSPFMATMAAFLKARGDDVDGASNAYFLFVKGQRMDSVPDDERVYMALTLNTDLGTGAGNWWLYAVKGQTVASLGNLESLNEDCVRLFQTKQGTTIFRRFWRQLIDPTPEETHTGTFDDVKLTPTGLQHQTKSARIDFDTKSGRAIWELGKADQYRCDVTNFRETASCVLEKVDD